MFIIRLNFEGAISHLVPKAKQSNDQTGKILCPRFIKTVKKINLLTYPAFKWCRILTGATVSMKNIIIFTVFFTCKYLNIEIKQLKIIST